MGFGITSESQLRAQETYDKKNTRQIKLKLNCKTDRDILQKLDRISNVQGYLKSLIRADMGAEK